ncbi:hypothetical protein [Dyadobacter luteus]|uniref:hypothetical protein n=1 Tax=Dyadobacter luteus TaxID=2259619 RepID=UPI0011C02307|nr:hypothetical protein [Dyadobacter luteus]
MSRYVVNNLKPPLSSTTRIHASNAKVPFVTRRYASLPRNDVVTAISAEKTWPVFISETGDQMTNRRSNTLVVDLLVIDQ